MALSKIQAESVNLSDDFAFTGTVTGAGLTSPFGNTVAVTSEGAAVSTNLAQGLAKSWARYDQINDVDRDSFNISSISDSSTGIFGLFYSNNFDNIYYATAGSTNQHRRFQVNGTGESEQATNRVFCLVTNEQTAARDMNIIGVHIHGDLA